MKQAPALQDVLALSSGTLATLTGETRYSRLDAIHAALIDYCISALHRGEIKPNATWNDVWARFKKKEGKDENQ